VIFGRKHFRFGALGEKDSQIVGHRNEFIDVTNFRGFDAHDVTTDETKPFLARRPDARAPVHSFAFRHYEATQSTHRSSYGACSRRSAAFSNTASKIFFLWNARLPSSCPSLGLVLVLVSRDGDSVKLVVKEIDETSENGRLIVPFESTQ